MSRTNQQPTFEINNFYEKIILFRKLRPKEFETLSPVTKLALAQYETQKREAARLQALRDEPNEHAA